MPKKLARTCSQLQRLASYKSHTHITFLVALQLTVLCDELWNLFVYTGKTNFYSVVMLVSYVARGSARLHIGDPIFQRADPIITSNASTLSRLYCFPPPHRSLPPAAAVWQLALPPASSTVPHRPGRHHFPVSASSRFAFRKGRILGITRTGIA